MSPENLVVGLFGFLAPCAAVYSVFSSIAGPSPFRPLKGSTRQELFAEAGVRWKKTRYEVYAVIFAVFGAGCVLASIHPLEKSVESLYGWLFIALAFFIAATNLVTDKAEFTAMVEIDFLEQARSLRVEEAVTTVSLTRPHLAKAALKVAKLRKLNAARELKQANELEAFADERQDIN